MNLNSLTAEIRPRISWEAVDLGISLTRRDYGTILKSKLLVVWPVWIILILLLRNHFGWLCFTLLWINVLWERITLYYISRSLFGGSRKIKDFLKEWPKWLFKRFFRSLFVTRLSASRSLFEPTTMLEDMYGALLSQRIRGLKSYSGHVGAKMGFIFMLCLHALWIQLVVVLYIMFPFLEFKELMLLLDAEQAPPPEFFWTCLASYLLVYTLLTPFYVGAGFGMYLNARTKMEGWDVELTFRKMANRISPAAIILFIGVIGLSANAQEATKDPQIVIGEVLKDDSFKIHTKTKKTRTYNNGGSGQSIKKPKENKRLRTSKTRKQKNRSSKGLNLEGFNLAIFGWIILATVAIYAIYLIAKSIIDRAGRDKAPETPTVAKTVMGMDVDQKSIPKDLISQARELWDAGKARESIALLYRGGLSWLIYTGNVPIKESDTELDCYIRSSDHLDDPQRIEYLKTLTDTWINIAYGKEPPSNQTMTLLFSQWPFEKQSKKVASKSIATTSAVILMAFSLSACRDYTEKEEIIEIGYTGKAKAYPFLALEKFLNAMSVDFYRVYSLTELPDTSTVLIYPQSIDHEEQRSTELRRWIRNGGSLVYMFDQPKSSEDKALSFRTTNPNPFVEPNFLLSKLGCDVTTVKQSYQDVDWGNKKYQWDLPANHGFTVPKNLWTKSKGYRVGMDHKTVAAMQVPYGKGLITLVNQSKPWKNRDIGAGDHASILWTVLKRDRASLKEVWLLRGTRASLWELLRRYAWMPMISILIFIIAWLCASIPRFGTLIPNANHSSRDFQEHLLMTGRFFSRQKMESALVEPVLGRLKSKLKQFDLSADSERSNAEWSRLSSTTGISEDSLRWALQSDPDTSPKQFLKRIQLLQRIDQKL